MMALEWGDVDLGKRQLCVARSDWKGHVTDTKGGRVRYVPLTTRLATALSQGRHLRSKRVLSDSKGQPLTQKEVQVIVRRVARRANVKPGVHILRHTFCSHLAMRGAPARAIQELAGHQDLMTTQRYMHLSPAALDAAIRLLEAGQRPPPVEPTGRRRELEAKTRERIEEKWWRRRESSRFRRGRRPTPVCLATPLTNRSIRGRPSPLQKARIRQGIMPVSEPPYRRRSALLSLLVSNPSTAVHV